MMMATQMQGSGGQQGGGRLRDVMTSQPAFIATGESIQRAAEMMDQLNVGALPVCDGQRLAGMVTDRDITVRCTAAGKDPKATQVTEAMSQEVQWCSEDDSVESAREKMASLQIRRLAVVDKDRHLVGVVSLGDLAVKGPDAGDTGDTLKEVSEPAKPDR
jgi:CBS domain-containing protein